MSQVSVDYKPNAKVEERRADLRESNREILEHASAVWKTQLSAAQVFALREVYLFSNSEGLVELRQGDSQLVDTVCDITRRLELLSVAIGKPALLNLFHVANGSASSMPLIHADICEDFGLGKSGEQSSLVLDKSPRPNLRSFLGGMASILDLSGKLTGNFYSEVIQARKDADKNTVGPSVKFVIPENTKNIICSAVKITNDTARLRSPQKTI